MQNISDSLLVKKIKLGDKNAFDTLFFKYYNPLYRFAFNFCKDSEVAEESVQRTFIKIWQNHANFPLEDTGKILFTYTKNTVIDEIRKNYTRKKYEGSVVTESTIDENNANDEKNKIKAIIDSGIETLPKKTKKVFQLAKQEGLTIKEIASYLKISNKTVENQLTIAYKKLRVYLEPYKSHLNF